MDGEGEGALAGLGAGVLHVARARLPVGQLSHRVGAVAAAALVGRLGCLGRLGRTGRLGVGRLVCVGVGVGVGGRREWDG